MVASKPNLRLRGALEAGIRVAGPGLDLLLLAGDAVSRVLARGDQGYGVVRMDHGGRAAPRGLDDHPVRGRTA